MEKILFENQHKHSEQMYKEFAFHRFFKGSTGIFFVVLSVLFVLLSVLFLVGFLYSLYSTGVVYQDSLVCSILSLPVVVVWWLVLFAAYKGNTKFLCKQDLERNGGAYSEVKYTAYENEVTLEYINSEYKNRTAITYESIKKVMQTKNYCFLISKAELVYAFKKDSFTLGTYEEFLIFLRSKGLK